MSNLSACTYKKIAIIKKHIECVQNKLYSFKRYCMHTIFLYMLKSEILPSKLALYLNEYKM